MDRSVQWSVDQVRREVHGPGISVVGSSYSKCCALNQFFIMLERNSVHVHSNTRHSSRCKTENRLLAVQLILENFLTV